MAWDSSGGLGHLSQTQREIFARSLAWTICTMVFCSCDRVHYLWFCRTFVCFILIGKFCSYCDPPSAFFYCYNDYIWHRGSFLNGRVFLIELMKIIVRLSAERAYIWKYCTSLLWMKLKICQLFFFQQCMDESDRRSHPKLHRMQIQKVRALYMILTAHVHCATLPLESWEWSDKLTEIWRTCHSTPMASTYDTSLDENDKAGSQKPAIQPFFLLKSIFRKSVKHLFRWGSDAKYSSR